MIARGLIDISTLDLLATFYRQASKKAQKESLLPWHNQAKFSLYSFSERTAFDAILQQLALAKKSDIIFTAYNIADFFTLAKHHQLNAIPCDINLDTLSPTNEQLEAALTPNTKAIVVAHLFGSRINMDCIAAFAKKHKLKIIEDCAQSYAGDKYLGHAQTDYTLFSFGPIKTATCLGGALIHCKDKEVANELSALQANYPQQSNSEFQQKVKKFLKVKWLSKPNRLAKFKKNCELKNEDFDDIISQKLRSLPANEPLLDSIRLTMSNAQLRLLLNNQHNSQQHREYCKYRAMAAKSTNKQLNPNIVIGKDCFYHHFWIFPVLVANREYLITRLQTLGFDAHKGSSSMVLLQKEGYSTPNLQHLTDNVLYVPMYPQIPTRILERMSSIINSNCKLFN